MESAERPDFYTERFEEMKLQTKYLKKISSNISFIAVVVFFCLVAAVLRGCAVFL